MNGPVIDYYLSPVSPWNYLASVRFRKLAEKHNAKVNVFIVDLGQVFAQTGGIALPKRSAQRQAYRLQELSRFSRYLDIKLNPQPAHFPPSSGLCNLVVVAGRQAGGAELAMAVSECLFAQLWANEVDIGDADTVISALDKAGLEGGRLVQDAQKNNAEYAQMIDADSKQAIAANVFGGPSFVVDGEVFWGQDRLELLDWYLSQRS